MLKGKRVFVSLICAIVFVLLVQGSAFADNTRVTSRTFSYREYKVVENDVKFLLPDEWMYIEELSSDNMVIFSGVNGYAALVVQTLSLPDYYKENIYALGDLFLEYYSTGDTLLSLIAIPVTYNLNGTESVILVYLNQNYETAIIQMEIMAVSGDNIVSVIIQDTEESFLKNFELYEMFLQSLTFNQSESGTLKNLILN